MNLLEKAAPKSLKARLKFVKISTNCSDFSIIAACLIVVRQLESLFLRRQRKSPAADGIELIQAKPLEVCGAVVIGFLPNPFEIQVGVAIQYFAGFIKALRYDQFRPKSFLFNGGYCPY